MAKSISEKSDGQTKCTLCGTRIPAGKTFRMVFDDAGNHVGDRCYLKCRSTDRIIANKDQRLVIQQRLAEYEGDERLKYPPANVSINAPLALVQVDLAARVNTLKWVLKVME